MRKEELASRPELKQQQQSRGRNCLEIVDASKIRKKYAKFNAVFVHEQENM